MAVESTHYQRIRHSFKASPVLPSRCFHDGRGPRHWLHRIGSRCSMCFRYFPHYALDSSRRCDECRP